MHHLQKKFKDLILTKQSKSFGDKIHRPSRRQIFHETKKDIFDEKMKILILLPLLLTFQTSFASTLVGVGDAKSTIQGCRTFTVDKCTEGGIHETVTDVDDVTTCQTYCRDIFTEFCKFFMLDFKQKVALTFLFVTCTALF